MPLVAVFLLALGLTSNRLAGFFRQRIALVKLVFASMFIIMAMILIFNLRQVL
jgi:hypothetical protein